MAIAVLIGASLGFESRYGIGASTCEIKLNEDGACTRTIKGAQSRYRVTQATIHAGFIRLRLMRPGEPRRMQLVPRDAVEPEVYRNLLTQIVQRRLPAPDNKTSA